MGREVVIASAVRTPFDKSVVHESYENNGYGKPCD